MQRDRSSEPTRRSSTKQARGSAGARPSSKSGKSGKSGKSKPAAAKDGSGKSAKGSKKKSSSSKHRSWPAITMVVLGAILVLISGGSLVLVSSLLGQVNDAVAQESLLGEQTGAPAKLDGPINILMVGVDSRPGESAAASRADTIIILHVPPSHDQAYLISVPRDLLVQLKPFKKSRYGGGTAKMTEAFFHGAQNNAGVAGGIELLSQAITDTLGVKFTGAALINFQGFEKVIKELGGVEMCFDQTVTSKHMVRTPSGQPLNIENEADYGVSKGKPIVYPKGVCRKLEAWEALDFSRQRYGLENGDYDRQRHQQQLLRAMVTKATSAGVITNPGRLNAIIKATGNAFVIDTRGVPTSEFIVTLGGIGAGGLSMVRTNAGHVTSTQIDGISYEKLTGPSEEMFKALSQNQIETFLVSHPEYLSQS